MGLSSWLNDEGVDVSSKLFAWAGRSLDKLVGLFGKPQPVVPAWVERIPVRVKVRVEPKPKRVRPKAKPKPVEFCEPHERTWPSEAERWAYECRAVDKCGAWKGDKLMVCEPCKAKLTDHNWWAWNEAKYPVLIEDEANLDLEINLDDYEPTPEWLARRRR